MATGKIFRAIESIKMLNLTSGQLEKLIYELEDLVSETEQTEIQEEQNERFEISDLNPYHEIAKENCFNI